ncbi:MAG: BMP family ABC transporter substrate-binding protein [Proteobacteria bacterium]|nr:BMP family ABC transporter substrate-binding protein [Pseudomonadota bacterium]MBU1582409.1 BMP family ABC transporter substrate-binding protein [Pseudomonadota bacterium]MBU2456067.1 BMP family ABC transporter substrate-binding protein [Pseudomonadota bacterium]MBU2630323.1 BMP family ABC transporter substrate-binding protein [Pseudomonadota bacterium]
MKKLLVFWLSVLCCAVVFSGTASAKKFKVAMVTDVGGVNDQSFNQSAWEGLQRAQKELGVKISYKESKQDADYSPNMETLTDAQFDLIWGIGFLMGDAIKSTAQINPNQKYAIIDFAYGPQTPKNVGCVVFQEEQPSFLVGYIAGKMTKTNKVGFVGGIKFPLIERFEYGYMAGVKLANPKCEILSQYAESFTDAAKGKAIANNMYQQNADIVFHASGSVGDGVIEAAKEKNKWAIGVDKDQNFLAPDNVLTSAMKRVDNAIFDMVKKLTKDEFKGGETIVYNLSNDGVSIAPTSSKHVSKSILDEVDSLIEQIKAGKIVVPSTKQTYDDFLK